MLTVAMTDNFLSTPALARSLYPMLNPGAHRAIEKSSSVKYMNGIYREIARPDHMVKVIQRDADGISYEDGGRIVCTKRIRSFDLRFKKDHSATVADLVSGFKPVPVKL